MCFGNPASGGVQYPSCLCLLMPVYSRTFNRALAEAKLPAPSGLPAHLKDGGDPLLPNAAWAFVHLTGPLPFGTTPTAETAKQPEVATTVFNLGLALPLHTSAWIQR